MLARLTGGQVDPEMAKALKDMGIDQVDPAMLQMMVGQMQSMFASTDTDAVQPHAGHRHGPQDGVRGR